METIIFDWWWRSHQSLARKGLRIFRFCDMPWKDEREPTIKYCLGRQVDMAQKFITIQCFWTQLMVSQWNSSGIFSQDSHHIAALQQKSKSSCGKNERRARRIYRTDHLHVDVQRHLIGDRKTRNRKAMLTQTSFLSPQEDFHLEDGHSSDLDRKRSGILLVIADHKENGTESLNWWWKYLEKADTQFSVPRVHCPKERSNAKEVDNYQCTSALMEERLKLFFAQLFVLTSSVSTEQSQICVRNIKPAT